MTRILMVETASPKRVRKTAEKILARGTHPGPEVIVLCTPDPATVSYLCEVPGIRVIPLSGTSRVPIPRELRKERFDILHVFWTGEKKYRRMKLRALRLRADSILVDGGDGNVFRLTWKAWIKFGLFRLRHPLPTDHSQFVPQPNDPDAGRYYQGEKILIVQSAPPTYVLRALDRLSERSMFRNPRYILFCRNERETVELFKDHPMIHEVRAHTEMRDSWSHLRALRRNRFDGVVVFFTGDRSFWKIKYFAFLLGARHKLIFNENNDCSSFSFGGWLRLLAHRFGERSLTRGGPGWPYQLGIPFYLLIKLVVFPFRFAWLLLVWLRLRLSS